MIHVNEWINECTHEIPGHDLFISIGEKFANRQRFGFLSASATRIGARIIQESIEGRASSKNTDGR